MRATYSSVSGWYCDDTTPASESYQFDAGGLTWYQGNLRWGQDLNPLGVQCNSNNIYKHSANLTPDQERFRVIIVNGDVTINMEKTTNGDKLHGWDMNEMYCDKDGDGRDHENYAVIISLHGNIRIFSGGFRLPEINLILLQQINITDKMKQTDRKSVV